MKHFYLSPHLDDAVLSCGGAIHSQAATGDSVQVITILAGDFAGSPSSFARIQHDYWGNPPQPMVLRRAEDLAALARLNAQACHLSYLDAVYRAGSSGQWLYDGEDAIFGDVHPDDPLLQEGARAILDDLIALVPRTEPAVIYAPIGTGHHVDHQVVHALARKLEQRGYRLAYYEEVPYALKPEAVETALASTASGRDWRPEVIPLGTDDLAAKIEASAYYQTQLSVLFGSAQDMPDRLRELAGRHRPKTGLGERLWWPARRVE